jgi:anti-anti-sigma factor
MNPQVPPQIRIRFERNELLTRNVRRTAMLITDDPGSDDRSLRLGLIVSELVLNTITHTGGGGCVSIWRTSDGSTVRVEVEDDSPRFPPLDGSLLEHRRGLLLVDRCATRWGVRQHDHGKVVWAELSGTFGPETKPEAGDVARRLLLAMPVDRYASSTQTHASLNGCLIAEIDATRAILTLVGEFDGPELADLRPTLEALGENPPRQILLDLGGVSYLGVGGLRALAAMTTAARARGSTCMVTSASRLVERLVQATGAAELLNGMSDPPFRNPDAR